jgi:hypothetical protein
MPTIRRILGAFIIFSTMLCGQIALAAELKQVGSTLLMSGRIEEGDADKVINLLQSNRRLQLHLDSNGGSVVEALEIGEALQRYGITTHLPNGSTCASACVTIFAGGVIRTAAYDAKIGIHMASGVFNEYYIDVTKDIIREYGVEATPYLTSLFEEMAASIMMKQVYFMLNSGVSLRLLEATTAVSHLEIYWMSREDAISVNLINHTS